MRKRTTTKSTWRITLLLLTAPLITMSACAGLTQDLQYRRPVVANPAYFRETSAIRLSIDPILDEARSKAIFNHDSAKLGILPIHVSVENTSTDKSLVVQKQQLRLSAFLDRGSHIGRDLIKYRSETEGKIGDLNITGLQRTYSVIVSIMFGWGAGGLREYSSEINHNYTREELLDATIQPSQKASGCVYFRIPDRTPVDGFVLEATIIELGTQKRHVIEFEIADRVRP